MCNHVVFPRYFKDHQFICKRNESGHKGFVLKLCMCQKESMKMQKWGEKGTRGIATKMKVVGK